LALQGHGAAILPKYLAAEFVRSGQLTELFPSSKVSAWPLYVLTASRSLSQQMRKLIAHVQSQLAQIQR
jgi:DNA-binding transcriptional LysR family regulator